MKYIVIDEYNSQPAENICFSNRADTEEYILSLAQERFYYDFINHVCLSNTNIDEYFHNLEENANLEKFSTFHGDVYDFFTYDLHIYELKELF